MLPDAVRGLVPTAAAIVMASTTASHTRRGDFTRFAYNNKHARRSLASSMPLSGGSFSSNLRWFVVACSPRYTTAYRRRSSPSLMQM